MSNSEIFLVILWVIIVGGVIAKKFGDQNSS